MSHPFDLSPGAPWRRRFRARSIQLAELAPARPDRGLVLQSASDGTSQIHAWDTASGETRQLTDHPGGIGEAWLIPDGSAALYLRDDHGDEHGHLCRVPLDGGPATDLTPELPPYALRGVGVAGDASCLVLNMITAAGFQLYVCDLRAGAAPRLLASTAYERWDPVVSADGRLVAAKSTERAGGQRDYALEVFDLATGAQIGGCWDGQGTSLAAVAFAPTPGDERLLATSTRGGVERPLLWNPRTDARVDIPLPELEGDITAFGWSPDGTRLLLGQLHRAQQQLYTYDLRDGALVRLAHPGGTYYNWDPYRPCWMADETLWCVWEDATHPREVLVLDARSGARLRTALANVAVPAGVPWRSVDIPSSEGAVAQAWLAVPPGEGPFPTLIELHGGPHWVRNEIYDPVAQTLLEQGCAFLSLNFRGSLTFGRAYQTAIWGEPGRLELDDLVAARGWLVAAGVARPDAIFLHGSSYGGYLTLWGLGRRPDLWAGGIAMVPVADWLLNYADAAPVMRAAFAAWFQGTPETRAAQYRASSPITYAEQVQAPVQIVHARNDTRTTPRQVAAYAERLRELGKDVELIWIDGGHMLVSEDQQLALMEHMLAFIGRTLAGGARGM